MNSARLLIALASSALVFPSTARAESDAAKGSVAAYQLQNRSTFQVDPEARAPFWPIGWQKPKAGASVQARDPMLGSKSAFQLQPSHFNVTSVLLGNPALVTINGRTFGEGELLPVVSGSQRLRVLVRAVRDGGVWLDHDGRLLFVPMHRPELGTKRLDKTIQPTEFAITIPQPKAQP